MYLRHVTLLNGHCVLHRLDTISPLAVAMCRKLLPRGGDIPGVVGYRVEVVERTGFTVYKGEAPLVSCGLGEGRDATWETLVEMQARYSPVPESLQVPSGRWLAVVILPSIVADFDAACWLGDFERCMAAAMLGELAA